MVDLPEGVTLLAATKGRTDEEIMDAFRRGVRIFGENYVQEAEGKTFPEGAKLHLIGHLQSNKVRRAVALFDCIQTVDGERLARMLEKEAERQGKHRDVCIEVNITREENKDGCDPDEVLPLAETISSLPHLRLKGLMTMGPAGDAEQMRPYFRRAKELFDDLRRSYPSCDRLSMGMSDSYRVAVEEGATMVRLGSALFGPRRPR